MLIVPGWTAAIGGSIPGGGQRGLVGWGIRKPINCQNLSIPARVGYKPSPLISCPGCLINTGCLLLGTIQVQGQWLLCAGFCSSLQSSFSSSLLVVPVWWQGGNGLSLPPRGYHYPPPLHYLPPLSSHSRQPPALDIRGRALSRGHSVSPCSSFTFYLGLFNSTSLKDKHSLVAPAPCATGQTWYL